ncbi:hypothetical protein RB195_013863 [Necator americanus]|uniref:Uncharacterized protein n=1 Tax=Necator americanus TaxID=51031 RepID=A0ABR1DXQ0_NECAM
MNQDEWTTTDEDFSNNRPSQRCSTTHQIKHVSEMGGNREPHDVCRTTPLRTAPDPSASTRLSTKTDRTAMNTTTIGRGYVTTTRVSPATSSEQYPLSNL